MPLRLEDVREGGGDPLRRGGRDQGLPTNPWWGYQPTQFIGMHPSILLLQELAESRVPRVRERLRDAEQDSIECIAAGLHENDRREINDYAKLSVPNSRRSSSSLS